MDSPGDVISSRCCSGSVWLVLDKPSPVDDTCLLKGDAYLEGDGLVFLANADAVAADVGICFASGPSGAFGRFKSDFVSFAFDSGDGVGCVCVVERADCLVDCNDFVDRVDCVEVVVVRRRLDPSGKITGSNASTTVSAHSHFLQMPFPDWTKSSFLTSCSDLSRSSR